MRISDWSSDVCSSDLADAADILDPVGLGEAEVAVEPVPDIVAVEQEAVAVHPVELFLDEVGDRRLARARQAGEPEQRGALVLEVRAHAAADIGRLPMDILRPAPAEVPTARRDRRVGDIFGPDEAAHREGIAR